MVIGNGLIAKSFSPYHSATDLLIFASGVSDSKSSTPADFKREEDLLLRTILENPSKKIVYFSTTSITDSDLQHTAYIKHKIRIEELIRRAAAQYHIFRLSNLAGFSVNPHTVLNFLYFHILEGRHFDLWKHSERNIIDVEDVYRVADHILKNQVFVNEVVNIANINNYAVTDIVRSIEQHTRRQAVFTAIDKGARLRIDTAGIRPILARLDIRFDDQYLSNLLLKYYPAHDL